jgi:ATP-binding cassette subfamily C (CFTR/MRP) protein 1
MTSISLVFLRTYLSAGLIGLALNYAITALPFFENFVQNWSSIETAMVGPERLAEYASIAPEALRVIPGSTTNAWPATGDIEFIDMFFQYKESGPFVLKNVNVHVKSGEKIGIVGRTGAGKSSLTMALFRIHEVARGSIKIDGVDISTIGVKTLRSAMAIIPQTPVLFKGTLRHYLDPFDTCRDDQLWMVLRKVRLSSRVAGIHGQLDSPVEENGENFSVGERQMLCMSRALLRNARIVVMDEATAAIDHETDQNLQQVIRTEFASSTVLTIAHRLDTVLDSNRIMVFDQGRLVQCDAPASLVEHGSGIFFELCEEGGYLDRVMTFHRDHHVGHFS